MRREFQAQTQQDADQSAADLDQTHSDCDQSPSGSHLDGGTTMSGLTRQSFGDHWARLDAEAQANKSSHGALLRLIEFYRELDAQDRYVVDDMLAGWALDGDARQRFDALALIDEFRIRSALPAMRSGLARLEQATGPSVPSDRAKLERILRRLEASEDSPS